VILDLLLVVFLQVGWRGGGVNLRAWLPCEDPMQLRTLNMGVSPRDIFNCSLYRLVSST
jgi:hypothetical protein